MLSVRLEGVAYWGLVAGSYLGSTALFLAGVFGWSRSTPLHGAGHAGTPGQEALVEATLVVGAVGLFAGSALVIYGLGRPALTIVRSSCTGRTSRRSASSKTRAIPVGARCADWMTTMGDHPSSDRAVQGIILDIDGTLLDSNGEHAEAWSDALAEHGYYIDAARIRPLIGMGGDKVLPKLIGVSDESPTGHKISKRRGEIFRSKYLPQIRPFPRVRELIERLEDDGRQLVVASSASKEDLGALLEKAGVRDLLDGETSSDDAERSKPDPDIVHAALQKLDVPPDRVMMIGDTPYDVEAAMRAGIGIVALRSGGGWSDKDLRGAAAIYSNPAELLAHLDESPLGPA